MYICLISDCALLGPMQGLWVVQALVSVFFAVLFVQSGADKITDRKGNLDWLTGHFSGSFLGAMVPMLLTTLTVLELAAGVVSAIGMVEVLMFRTYCMAFAGALLCALALLSLFFGQRVAKDYAGAASLTPYFILAIIDLYLLAG